MKAQDHPHYPQEEQHLQRTVAAIEAYLERKIPVLGHAADNRTAHIVAVEQSDLVEQAQKAREQLYFGRVDWRTAGGETDETFYLGFFPFQDGDEGPRVYAWQNTLVGDLFFLLGTGREEGELRLKRAFSINDQTLADISDEYVGEGYDLDVIWSYSDDLLVELLEQAREGKLRTVVRTLQSRQYELITAPEDQILVIEGPPGSGKTEIALHRVSYLLYQQRVQANSDKRILVLGPNRLFMGYAAGVLPELGEGRVAQLAFDEWLYGMLDSEFEYEAQHLSLEQLLDPAVSDAVKTMHYRNAVHKGSLKMARLLENYVDQLQAEILAGKGDLVSDVTTVSGQRLEARLSPERIQTQLERQIIASRPFNERRDALEVQLAGYLFAQIRQQYPGGMTDNVERQIKQRIGQQVHAYFDDWRALNVSVAYRRLLRTPSLLRAAGRDLFTEWDLELLMRDAPTALVPFRFSDLPALAYLRILLDGLPEQPYEHIVVDEAQDITPLQFALLAKFCPEHKLTVIGDLKQGIFAHHGVGTWDSLLDTLPYQYEPMTHSYRSTQQVNAYANRLLQRAGVPDNELIDSISRAGPEPVQRGFDSLAAWAEEAAGVVNTAREEWATVAIICKSALHCLRVRDALAAAGLTDVELIENVATDRLAPVVIIPLHLAKGLEFDVVVLADADAATYPADTLHMRLLYVALTRAAHQLFVNWVGQLTPLLDDSSPLDALPEPFANVLQPRPVTVADFAARHPPLDPLWCVERLAGAEKLHLLEDGRIDETVIATMISANGRAAAQSVQRTMQPLAGDVRQQVIQRFRSTGKTADAQAGLALTQLAYALLRLQMRMAGLQLDATEEANPEAQVLALCAFQQFIDGDSSDLPPGRWTTERAVLERIAESRQETAHQLLNLLTDYGVVARNDAQIRVRSEQIDDLLRVALGEPSANWDPDLVAELTLPPRLFAGQPVAGRASYA